MDTSKERIEMSRKAVEIQEVWEPKVGDYIWRRYTLLGEEIDSQIWDEDKRQEIIILTYASSVEGYIHATNERGDTRIYKSHNDAHKSTSIWLPRQGQSQDMVFDKFKEILGTKNNAFIYDEMVSSFYDFCFNGKTTQQWPWNNYSVSMEQLWLAFVMHELYQKKWDGGEWVTA